jgi:hypothetical protein
MEGIKLFEYKGSPIQFEEVDGKLMANATLMCAAFGKKPADWQRSETAKRYIEAVMGNSLIAEDELVIAKRGGSDFQGTWIHEKLILNLARWLNVDFELWCDDRIAELLRTGKTSIQKLTPAELILQQAQQLVDHERKLDDLDVRVKKIEATQTVVNHTIMGYANLKRANISYDQAKELGKKATKICKEKNLETGYVPDQRHGQVRSYPKDVLETVFNEFMKIDKNY